MRQIILVALLLLPIPAFAWWDTGHQIVCDIAWKESSPATQAKIKAILASKSFRGSPYRTFATACTWADQIKSDADFKWSSPYHYINVPRSATRVNPARDCHAEGCLLTGIQDNLHTLKTAKSDSGQWQSLLFLGHYIGDLHQPLHVSYADDRGGNLIDVYFFGEEYSLHQLWDGGMIQQLWPNSDWRTIGKQLQQKITPQERQEWQQGEPQQWANESLQITRSIYAKQQANIGYGKSYLKNNRAIVEQRLQQAGVRLAMLLEQSL